MWGYIKGEWWWRVSRHLTTEKLCWKVAFLLPRKVALFTYIRVTSAGGDCDMTEYSRIYKLWESGAGK